MSLWSAHVRRTDYRKTRRQDLEKACGRRTDHAPRRKHGPPLAWLVMPLRALRETLGDAAARGFRYVEIATAWDHIASMARDETGG
jgi:hypothetical protein